MPEQPIKVLLAIDDTMWSKAAEFALSEKGISVYIAKDGAEAEEKLISESFTVAVLDFYMRIKSAAEVLKTVRHEGIKIPILVFSNTNKPEDRKIVLAEGASAYILKPNIDAQSLPRILKRYYEPETNE